MLKRPSAKTCKRIAALEASRAKQALEAASNDVNGAIVTAASVRIGMVVRAAPGQGPQGAQGGTGEVVGYRVNDVNYGDMGQVVVRRGVRWRRGQCTLSTLKTNFSFCAHPPPPPPASLPPRPLVLIFILIFFKTFFFFLFFLIKLLFRIISALHFRTIWSG